MRGVWPSPLVEGWQAGEVGRVHFTRGVRLTASLASSAGGLCKRFFGIQISQVMSDARLLKCIEECIFIAADFATE